MGVLGGGGERQPLGDVATWPWLALHSSSLHATLIFLAAALPMVVTKMATNWFLGKRGEGRQGIACSNVDVNTDMETRGPKASKEFIAAGSQDSSKPFQGG